jgi:hypothetical protein
MQDDPVMTKMPELEPVQTRHEPVDVGVLPENTTSEHKDRITRLNRSQSMIAALIRVNNEIIERRHQLSRPSLLAGTRNSPDSSFGSSASRSPAHEARAFFNDRLRDAIAHR